MDEAKDFVYQHELEETNLKQERIKRKKKMADEYCNDEVPIDPIIKFKTSVYLYTFDVIIGTINSHFQGNRGVLTDLSFFSYSRLKDAAKINVNSLRSEYLTFAASFESLEASNPEKNLDTDKDDDDDKNDEDDEEALKHDPKELGFSVRMI